MIPRRPDAPEWPPDGPYGEVERDRLVHTIGNLTLLTGRLNSKVSNGPWAGAGGKWEALQAHDVLLLNRVLRTTEPSPWTHETIRTRTGEMTKAVLEIWPVPDGHRSSFAHERVRHHRRIDLADLINAGLLTTGMTLYPGRKKFEGRLATLRPDGQIDVDGKTHARPGQAASAIAGRSVNGRSFFRVDKTAGRSLRDVLREYIATLAVDVDDDDADEDNEGDVD